MSYIDQLTYITIFILGMISLWLLSKWYCFENKKEWMKFKDEYSKKTKKKTRQIQKKVW